MQDCDGAILQLNRNQHDYNYDTCMLIQCSIYTNIIKPATRAKLTICQPPTFCTVNHTVALHTTTKLIGINSPKILLQILLALYLVPSTKFQLLIYSLSTTQTIATTPMLVDCPIQLL